MTPWFHFRASRPFQRASFLLACLFACWPGDAALPPEQIQMLRSWGIPRIETYYPRETGIRGDIHAFSVLPSGEIAILTSVGCYRFDGTHWDEISGLDWATESLPLPSKDQSLVAHRQGLTQLEPDGFGGYRLDPLTPPGKFPKGMPAPESIAVARDTVFGLAGQHLVVVHPDRSVAYHRLPNWATACFAIGDQVYFNGGLQNLLARWNWETAALEDCTSFLDAAGVYEWMIQAEPRAEGGVWLLTETGKILGFDGAATFRWPGQPHLDAMGSRVTSFAEIAPGTLALGTSSKGLVVIDPVSGPSLHLSKENGLESNNVEDIGKDPQNGIWLAVEQTLVRVPGQSNTLLFDESHGLTEHVVSLAFFQGRLFLGTPYGLYASNPQARGLQEAFTLVFQQNDIQDLLVVDDTLFISGGVTAIMDADFNVTTLDRTGSTNFIHPSRHPDTVLAGNFRGVHRYQRINGRWIFAERISGPEQDIYSIAEDRHGNLFGSLGGDQIARIILEPAVNRVENLALPNPNNGNWTTPVTIDGQIYVNTAPCVRWDQDQQAFVNAPDMHYYPGAPPYGFQQVYGTGPDAAYVAINARSGDTVPRPPAHVIGDISSIGYSIDTRAVCIAYDADGFLWAGGPFGLVRADPSPERGALESIQPAIDRLILASDGSLLPIQAQADAPLVLQPSQNAILLSVEFPKFFATRQHQFQIHVEGLDATWKEFSYQNQRELNNLKPGDYTLYINAVDALGRTFSAPTYHFTILTPWYLQPWAFIAYSIAFIALVIASALAYNRVQIRKARQLERLVRQRTAEVEAKNLTLKEQALTLEQQNNELEEKTEELQSLTDSLTDTLNRLQEMQDQLVATARTAGKAEIATNVLHNVGNVLNSINISLTLLSEKTAASKIAKLARLADLVSARMSDIDAFLTQDPKGKLVPQYLVQISSALQEEAAAVAYELEVMTEDVDHVKRIIAAQQAHAKNTNIAQDFHLRELFETALTILGKDQDHGDLEIINEIPPELVLHNDKHRLLEIVLNLIANAHDAIKEQEPDIGTLRLQAEILEDGETVSVSVTDNGVGIDPENRKSLFSHGFTTKQDGHGFGLHGSANAARVLGGTLSLDSPGLGLGATATITLPLHYESALKARPAAKPAAAADLPSRS